ncbi:DnaT-like ssDNA-binding protein [Pararhodospirillum oryzae]|uniref:Putative DnaT-like domain-containing protein n=1 Tax=Pararhodospirillum oryzae TaxID=478448 RepID=A0A512H4Q8_9PROT|nr:DnaT-like ssDNA-binding protein [Pararhodospirillum oryzae]GEO80442.1 hypothetical protein ROR02_05730 [Pararhodospirillum oryzae]
MVLCVETGAGLADADSYVPLASADAYWALRPHSPLAAPWAATPEETREGALREATTHIDVLFGPRFPGRPAHGRDQRLAWPRRDAWDQEGLPLPGDRVPREIVEACCELAARAITAPLMADRDAGPRVIEERLSVDALTTHTVYTPDASPPPAVPLARALLAPLLRPGGTVLSRT